MLQALCTYFQAEGYELLEWAKCGESNASVTPTLLWAVGTAALTQRMIRALFRRFIFRRVPMWEVVLQNLLFVWVVIYSLHFWVMLVKAIKVFVGYCYEDATILDFSPHEILISSTDNLESSRVMQQWVIWICGVVPLAVYVHTRPRPAPPLMIWITTSPWLRREMGPYGYYLNRPFSTTPSTTTGFDRQQALTLRKAFSDSNILIKEPPKRKRHSKSV